MFLGRGSTGTAMVERQDQAAGGGVVLHLLDSTRDRPLQTWQFTDRAEITIGRADGNDVVVIDPHVSRQHVKLVEQNGSWRLLSMGRHGTLIGSQPVAEFSLNHCAVFRLGPLGPMLRFENGKSAADGSRS
jgi:serine/threonine-protein kinase